MNKGLAPATAQPLPSWRALALELAVLLVTIIALYGGWMAAKRGQLIAPDFHAPVHLDEPAH